MSRKERRSETKRGQGGDISSRASWAAANFAQAVQHHQRGEWLAAESCCRAILTREPKHLGSLHLLGMMALQGRRYEDAAACFRTLIKIKPDFVLAHHNLGNTLAAIGRHEEAVSALERALAVKHAHPAAMAPDEARTWLNLGYLYEQLGKPEIAAKRYERALALRPALAEAHNNLGALLLKQGKTREASAVLARALAHAPELFASFADIAATLFKLVPPLRAAVNQAAAAWPQRLPVDVLLGPAGLAAIADDPLLCFVLESTTISDIAFEHFLTSTRRAILELAVDGADDPGEAVLDFCCVLARQCFINEYVFADTPEELEQVEALKRTLIAALKGNTAAPPLWLAAVASYVPLGSLPDARSMLERTWPAAVDRLLTQQIREVQQERELRDSIPRLSAIEEGASTLVRQQYEENPYPRWVLAPSPDDPLTVDEYLRLRFPSASYRPFGDRAEVDILIAGCGTGQHPIKLARRYLGARLLAVDLSLSSLCYAQRKTREVGVQNIEYGQADILQLGSIGRSFDIVDASGVLHHLAEPTEGWRRLLGLVRPGGLMRIAVYSELGRADVVAARRFIAQRGFQPTAADIRRCRQELLETQQHVLTRYHDFFSTSECRDLLFHVQEHRLTLPQIKEFLLEHKLRFIGFELDAASLQAYRAKFPEDRSMADLDRWNAVEHERPATFAAMYQFWCQRS